jgi:hypothetical protein
MAQDVAVGHDRSRRAEVGHEIVDGLVGGLALRSDAKSRGVASLRVSRRARYYGEPFCPSIERSTHRREIFGVVVMLAGYCPRRMVEDPLEPPLAGW